ncbi:TolC family protein [Chitinophaga sp. XS-30]|uniref:TolC family protein n=1 Tax=Chitinophaga sp. XS-30 TaxID=2604421 RepID=UPI0011DDA4FF|nr:TolC family protein [Chitinophaga sp. XS-30]QEH42509.1 TolC family protein [Chitinophaga sp. XS-30]
MNIRSLFLTGLFMAASLTMHAQEQQPSTGLPPKASLEQCIDFALRNKANVKQAAIDQEIGERDIASALSGWFPQIGATGTYNNNIIIPTAVIGDQVIQMGQRNVAALVLQADQQIVNPALLQASKAAKYVRLQNEQNTENTKINTIVEVSKAYYDILTSEEQLSIIKENIARITKQLQDAKARYETGIVDKTDFKRAQITLSNSNADLKRTAAILKYKYAYLKEVVGLSPEAPLTLSFDNTSMESEISLDTTVAFDYRNRIEYRQLQTQRQLQGINTQYNKWTYLPSLSAFYNYAWDYRNNSFSKLLDVDYPRSVFGLTLNVPIFQGMKRTQEIRKSQLMEERIDWDLVNLRNQINSQYEMAMATYKANLNDWVTARENVELSKEVYNTIKLQYDEGIKTYLDLMTAETDLRTTQVNYLNALYAVLSGKLDVQRAVGTIQTAR